MAILCSNPIYFFIVTLFLISSFPFIYSLSTVSISELSNHTLICAMVHSPNQPSHLNCTSFPEGIRIPLNQSGTSFTGIVGGNGFFAALRPFSSSNSIMVRWRFEDNGTNLSYKRIYSGPVLDELDSGNSHICGIFNGTNRLQCWQWPEFDSNGNTTISSNLAAGENFVCGLDKSRQVLCLGSDNRVTSSAPRGDYSFVSAGFRHACAISLNGSLECWGEMAGLKPAGLFTSLALGENRSCALRPNGSAICWGANNFSLPISLEEKSFVSIEAKQNVFCGILSSDFSLACWGNNFLDPNSTIFNDVVPGPCRKQCPCAPLPKYSSYCGQGLMICQPCVQEPSSKSPLLPPPSSPLPSPPAQRTTGGNSRWNKKMMAFLVVGCVGSVSLILVLCFLFFKYCKIKGCRVHDSGPLEQASKSQSQQEERVLEKKLSQLISMGNGGHLEEFSLQILLKATNCFSEEHKIGTGSFGSVYCGTLEDGRELAIKRAEISVSSSYNIYAGGTKRNQEDKDCAFLNELEFLSRLNHRNLVRLLGYCEESNERVLVYEYMDNGTLHDHLHKLQDSPLMSWAARIKVALDAARGIEYLHEYAVPQVIHRDIKPSNILLDVTWTAKVSDFGLSLMGPQDEESHLSKPVAGTVGYMDPEYYRMQQLTTKSDVYSFGIVLLELLSGRKAIHNRENGEPRNVVDLVVPYIVKDEIHRILDEKVPPPTPFEIEAVAYVGYLAADCVTLEGRDRPTMTEIVNSLERALAACLVPQNPVLSRSNTASSLA
ncbi:hypothetical protein M9H77_17986 [Catharanthus roseus]|uniref:Uncharacterized protein n=1 Tax=Catharanthus roseus TaxID=4058 RepID=A0ACC0B660_CATRO|nr:hypothetical protein M9H77_17986 [Catharanthus roseus]